MNPFFLYKPSSLTEIKGQSTDAFSGFFSTFKKGTGVFLYGPPGTGKTSSVYAYAKENGYDLLELNASDTRSKSQLKEFLSNATGQRSLFGNKKIILLDEVDGLSGTKDRGAPTVIVNFIKSSTFPIVLTGINIFDKKFSALKKSCKLVEFIPVTPGYIVEVMKTHLDRQGISCDEKILKTISINARGDVRAALNDLFAYVVIKDSEIGDTSLRRQTETMANALVKVFKSTDPDVVRGSFDLVDENLDKIFLWVDENLPKEYTESQDISRAYDILSKADIFFGRIRRWQYYRFYAYCYLLLSVGIALSKDKRYVSPPNYKQPFRLLRYWQANMTYAKRKSIVEKIAQQTHTSSRTALQSFHDLRAALAEIEELDLTEDELQWIKKVQSS